MTNNTKTLTRTIAETIAYVYTPAQRAEWLASVDRMTSDWDALTSGERANLGAEVAEVTTANIRAAKLVRDYRTAVTMAARAELAYRDPEDREAYEAWREADRVRSNAAHNIRQA